MTLSVRLLREFLLYAGSRGLKPDDILRAAGVSESILSRTEEHIDLVSFLHAIDYVKGQLRDANLALNYGASFRISGLDLLCYIAQNCRNLRAALEDGCRYQNLISNLKRVELKDYRGLTAICIVPHPTIVRNFPEFHIFQAEATLAMIRNMVNELSGAEVVPTRVCFAFRKPKGQTSHELIFSGSRVEFARSVSCLEYFSKDLEHPVQRFNSKLHDSLCEYADAQLRAQSGHADFVDQVRTEVFKLMGSGQVDLQSVADSLCLSPRSLQRRLKESLTTFHRVVDEAKRDLALYYIQRLRLPVSEVAFLLGYSTASSFVRSFGKWTGKPPSAFR